MGLIEHILKEANNHDLTQNFISSMEEKGFDIEKLDIENYLGQGSYKSVYKINDKFVCKAGDPESDIRKINKMVGNKFDNVAKIHYAESVTNELWDGVYVEIQDYVPFASDSSTFVKDEEKLIEQYGEEDLIWAFTYKLNGAEHFIAPFVKKLIKQGICEEDSKEDLTKMFTDIANGIEELQNFVRKVSDIHSDNVRMTKDGTYKIIDFIIM